MKEIKKTIDEISLNINKMDNNENQELFQNINLILSSLADKVEEIMVNQAALAENIKYLDADVSGIQDELFEEVSLEELESFDEEYKEIKCKNCNKPIYIEASVDDESEIIGCPYCGKDIR